MRKIFIGILLAVFCAGLFFVPIASAQILPSGVTETYKSCDEVKDNEEFKNALASESAFKSFITGGEKSLGIEKQEMLDFLLGCAIKTGKIRLFMMPFFITYLIEFLLQIAGLIAVLFIVYGGFKYVTGGLIEDKESGKKAVLHAIIGLLVALSAWIVVNFIQMALTS